MHERGEGRHQHTVAAARASAIRRPAATPAGEDARPLDGAVAALEQRRAELSIVGRALTEAEQRELEAIECALGCLGALQPEPDPARGPTLADDGRYEVANDALFVELRVDVAGSGLVSGDVFAIGPNVREYLASLRTEPGLALDGTSATLPIVAEGVQGERSRGTVTLFETGGGEVIFELTVDEQIRHLPAARPVLLTGRFVSGFMRSLGVEVARERNVDIAPEWQHEGRTVTVESCFEEAGIETFASGRSDTVPPPAGGRWHDGQLHGLMTDYADEPMDRPRWNLHLLWLAESLSSRLLGVMFDSGNRDVNRLPRQGAAVFWNPIRPRADAERKLIQTTVHELGHALNLAHRFERPVGRADSTSFMNYDWRYLGGNNTDKFWREFDFSFDPDELAFLRHGPWQSVIPGGAEFHTVPYWENTDGGYSPYQPEVPGTDLALRLAPPGRGPVFDFGQPVMLTVELENLSARRLNLPWYILDPKAGFLELVVKRLHDGVDSDRAEVRVFRPITQRCFDLAATPSAADILSRGDTMSNNVNLTFGSAGFGFAEPGSYEITAVLTLTWRGGSTLTYKSPPLAVRVAHPRSREDETDALDLFRFDVGYYLALGGSHAYAEARDKVMEVKERRLAQYGIGDGIAASLVRSTAIEASRGAVRYSGGRHRRIAPRADEARAQLESLADVGAAIFDPWTWRSTQALAAKLA